MITNLKKIQFTIALLGQLAFFSSTNNLIASNSVQKDFHEEEKQLQKENSYKTFILRPLAI